MKRLGGIVLLAAILLTGCASGAPTMAEDDYFELVRGTDGLENLTDDNIRTNGKQVCGVFETSDDAYVDALKVFLDNGIEAGTAGAFITLSVTQYCPDRIDALPIP